MRRFMAWVAAAALLLGAAEAADAKILGFGGTLSIELGPLFALGGTGSCGVGCAVLNGSAGGDHLTTLFIAEPGVVAGSATVVVTDPNLSPLVSLRGTAVLGTGHLFNISGGAGSLAAGGGTLPVAGEVRLCAFFMCSGVVPPIVTIPLTVNGTRGVGIGGLITVNGFGNSPLRFSVGGAPWTIKTAAIPEIPTPGGGFFTSSRVGFAHGPVSQTSSTAQASGVVQLVTPVVVQTTIEGAEILPTFATLRIHLVPEPSSFLLFGSGVAALGIAARSRAKK
jgi:hypothetical protein